MLQPVGEAVVPGTRLPLVRDEHGGPQPRLLDQVRTAVRVRHLSRRTEKAYVAWIRRYVCHHGKRHPREMGAVEVTAFLSWLAETKGVAASTQNQRLPPCSFFTMRYSVSTYPGSTIWSGPSALLAFP